ncbi:MAG: phage terminase large subunit [Oscillospiraceae bacterium]|nr:phage terminase large subunit [Oscillospiraceae bacterium]
MRKNNKKENEPIIIRPQKGKQELFLRSPADICIYGGAAGGGKTYALLLECLRNIDRQHFEAVIFRQSRPQIMSAGGLYATSQELYPYLGATSVLTPNVQWRFQSGAKITFAHMFYEKEKYNWQGSQIPLLMFDELTHFTESQFFYMFSRNRSTCGVKPYIRATCNPDGESWVAKFIDWWIDPETGYADESRCGKIRYFVRKNNIIHWANTPCELYESFNLNSPEEKEDVKSVSFISAKLTDNEAMMKHDPGYMGALKAMSEFDQEQLLYGNWKIRKSAGHYFKRSKIGEMLLSTPSDVTKWVRAWDLAATAPDENNEMSDLPQSMRRNSRNDDSAYTAGVLLGKRRNGRVFVADVINVRENGADVRKLILNTAASDNALYGNVTVRLPQDPGQAGKDQVQSFVRMLGGYTVTTSLESGDKVTRAEPFSSQWLAGNVDVKIAEWNDDYFRQLENFPVGKLKDMVDASANAYLELENAKPEFGFTF